MDEGRFACAPGTSGNGAAFHPGTAGEGLPGSVAAKSDNATGRTSEM